MNKNYCVMPFFGAEYDSKGFSTSCCLMNSHDIAQVRAQMLQGTRPDACSACWKLEDNGVKSDREFKNKTYDYYANRDIRYVFDDCINGKYSKQIVKLYTSNLCNGACVTCGPTRSTHWASVKSIPIKLDTMPDSVLDDIDFKNLKILSILGGEPLYDRNIYRILQLLIDNSNLDCFINFVTNGSVTLTDSQLDMFAKFKNVDICVSIDGIGPVFEYMRFPLKWPKLLENIAQYKTVASHVSVSYTLSNVNILYYKETVDWLNSQGLLFNHNLVRYPAHYNINSLPESVKATPAISHFFREHQPTDDLLFNQAVTDLTTQDQLKKISARDFVARFTDLI
jgi:sulfatase maturation enzyme AslB (radical SAM superfamily)